jgi:hypothetical protein
LSRARKNGPSAIRVRTRPVPDPLRDCDNATEKRPRKQSRGLLELALRHDAKYYDAAYVALALEEGIPLLATDGPMTQKFKGLVEFVTLQSDFTGARAGR